jgi:hypothetical protein
LTTSILIIPSPIPEIQPIQTDSFIAYFLKNRICPWMG